MTELETLQLAGKALGYTVTENGTVINGYAKIGADEIMDRLKELLNEQ